MKKFKEFLNEEHNKGKVDPKKFLSEEQIQWCNRHIIQAWWVNDHGEVQVESSLTTKKDPEITEFPVQFADVNGDFNCSNCINLTSLKGAPRKVGGSFFCVNCASLISLEGLPKKFNLLRGSCPKLPQVEQDFLKDEDLQEKWKKSPLVWKQFMYTSGAAKGRKFCL